MAPSSPLGCSGCCMRPLSKGIAGSDTLQLLRVVSFRKIWGPVAGVFGLVGILVGVGGSLTAIRKFLRV